MSLNIIKKISQALFSCGSGMTILNLRLGQQVDRGKGIITYVELAG